MEFIQNKAAASNGGHIGFHSLLPKVPDSVAPSMGCRIPSSPPQLVLGLARDAGATHGFGCRHLPNAPGVVV